MFAYSLFRVAPSSQCITSTAGAFLSRISTSNRTQTCGYAKKVGVVLRACSLPFTSDRWSNYVVMLINENDSTSYVTTPNVTVNGPALRRSPSNYTTTPIICSVSVRRAPRLTIRTYQTGKRTATTSAAKGKGKGMIKEVLKGPEVCKDPIRLTSYAVGVNIYKQGEDPKLKPQEEYPEWLFQLNLGNAKKLHELEEDTWEYWKRLRKDNIWRHNRLNKGKKL